jgi:hypothetical protein
METLTLRKSLWKILRIDSREFKKVLYYLLNKMMGSLLKGMKGT